MRRLFIFLIILLLMLSSSSAEESQMVSFGAVDSIKQKYGVQVYICETIPYEYTYDHYSIDEIRVPDMTLKSLVLNATINDALLIIEESLSEYPEIVMDLLREKMIVFLVGNIVRKEDSLKVAGFFTGKNEKLNLFLDVNQIIPTAFHHEVWHAIEHRTGAVFSDWEQYNPEGFTYKGFSSVNNDYDPEWFYRAYSVVNEQEDRATVFEACLLENAEWWHSHPHIQKKLEIMLKETGLSN